jgi:Cu-Zn family superoxide dismutase
MSNLARTKHRLVASVGAGARLAVVAVAGASGAGAVHADATIRDAAGTAVGWARLSQDATGTLHLTVHARALNAGLHGIHIHAVGDCDPFADASGHLNPDGNAHGLEAAGGPHDGDLPNLRVNAAGVGVLSTATDRASLSINSIFDANGSAIVIHQLPDDQVTQPIGGSGARIACGVIEAD